MRGSVFPRPGRLLQGVSRRLVPAGNLPPQRYRLRHTQREQSRDFLHQSTTNAPRRRRSGQEKPRLWTPHRTSSRKACPPPTGPRGLSPAGKDPAPSSNSTRRGGQEGSRKEGLAGAQPERRPEEASGTPAKKPSRNDTRRIDFLSMGKRRDDSQLRSVRRRASPGER